MTTLRERDGLGDQVGVGDPTAALALVDGICCGYIIRQEAFVQSVQPRQGNLLLTTPLLRLQIPSPHSRTVGLASLEGARQAARIW